MLSITPNAPAHPVIVSVDGSSLVKRPVERRIAEADPMYANGDRAHYESVGLSALFSVDAACRARASVAGGFAPVRDLLDVGCGYGRAARFLRAGFPDATVWVADDDAAATRTCVELLGCRAAPAAVTPATIDVVWLGSALGHLPETAAAAMLDRVVPLLRDGGVVVFGAHGRYTYEIISESLAFDSPHASAIDYGVTPYQAATLCRDYESTGYGYADYPGQPGYGVSVVRPDWYARRLASSGLRQILLHERSFDDHQDALAFMRADIRDERVLRWRLPLHSADDAATSASGPGTRTLENNALNYKA